MKGLHNFGNTCYLNSILQILFNTPNFPQQFREYTGNRNHPLYPTSMSFASLMDVYLDPARNDRELRKALLDFVQIFHHSHSQYGFGMEQEQDGHEYLTFLMRAIHDSMFHRKRMRLIRSSASLTEVDRLEQRSVEAHRVDGSSTTELRLRTPDKEPDQMRPRDCYDSVIFQTFTGQYRFQTQCRNPKCKYVSNRFETFRSCELPIGNPNSREVQLSDVLDEFTSVTELEEQYECDRCQVRTNSYRRCSFWRLPEVLVLSLKRNIHYQDKDGNYHIVKDNRAVHAPDQLDMAKWCSAPRTQTKYELYATGNHLGDAQGGHYYAHIRKDKEWYVVNDNHITKQGAPAEHKCLLFYKLKYNND